MSAPTMREAPVPLATLTPDLTNAADASSRAGERPVVVAKGKVRFCSMVHHKRDDELSVALFPALIPRHD